MVTAHVGVEELAAQAVEEVAPRLRVFGLGEAASWLNG